MLKGTKVFLRTLEPTDSELLLDWENDPSNWKVSNTMVPFSKELIYQYVHSAQDIYAVKQVRFIVCCCEDEREVGAVDLFDFDPKHQRAGVGILIRGEEQSKGFAAEALQLVEDYALNHVGIRNLYCNILEDNDRSIALFEKQRFIKVGHKSNWFNHGGRWLDEFLYQKELV